jgi:hypothetical protein
MGRPIKKSFFGNLNQGSASTLSDDGIGGEGVASINWSNYGSWMAVAGGASTPLNGLALPAPTIVTGVQAAWNLVYGTAAVTTGAGKAGLNTGDTYTYADIPGSRIVVASTTASNATFNVTVAGTTSTLITDTQGVYLTKVTGTGTSTFLVDVYMNISSATTITEPGSGYNGTETFTVTLANGAAGTVPAGTLVDTTSQDNAITIISYLPTASQSRTGGDIIKQESSRRYLVRNSDGYGQCTLTTGTLTAGYMHIIASDFYGGTYYVTKLTAHRAVLQVRSNTSSCIYASGEVAPWNITAATGTYVTLNHTI